MPAQKSSCPTLLQLRRRQRRSTSKLPKSELIGIAVAAARLIGSLTPGNARELAPPLLRFFSDHAADFAFLGAAVEQLSSLEDDYSPARLSSLRTAIVKAGLRPRPNALDQRVDWLRKVCSLSAAEADVVALAIRPRLFETWARFHEAATGSRHGSWLRPEFVARFLGFSEARVREALGRQGRLVRTGLIEDHRDDDYSVSPLLIQVMRVPGRRFEQLEATLLKPAPTSELAWEDFRHIPHRDLAANVIASAIRRRQGINILLYGEPGTGKSEFVRALADHIGSTAHFVGETNYDGYEPSRSERLAHLSMMRALTRPGEKRLIVVDEADDMMISPFGADRNNASKLWLNQLIESSSVPTIWIVNDVSVLGGPVIRRMALALPFKIPPAKVRSRAAKRHAGRLKLALRSHDAARLGEIKVPPAVAASALMAASLSDGSIEAALAAAHSVQRALGYEQTPLPVGAAAFDPALSRANEDLASLTQRLATSDDRRWSLLLSGPPGTGKSAFAHHLAEACGLEVVEKRASDLLDMFVGGTEKAIAGAFREAADQRALLLIDEADSILRDRRQAQRAWEVSMVNEMLSWMELHPLPFVATTNLAEDLDPATSRRFLFKLRFETLDIARSRLLFERTFNARAPSELDYIEDLTPSDFSLVARRAKLLGNTDVHRFLEMLREEAEVRRGAKSEPFGFSIPRQDAHSFPRPPANADYECARPTGEDRHLPRSPVKRRQPLFDAAEISTWPTSASPLSPGEPCSSWSGRNP